jgi:hypothetical protein
MLLALIPFVLLTWISAALLRALGADVRWI